MKILVVSQYFYPENFRINDLVCRLIERGHEVTVLTGQPNYPQGHFVQGYGWRGPWKEKIFNADVIRIPLIPRNKGNAFWLIFNYLSFAFFACLGVIFRVTGSFDVIFVFEISPITVAFPAIVASKKFKCPILFWVLDLWPDSLKAVKAIQSPFLLCLFDKMVAWIYRNCTRILVASKGFVDDIVKHGKSIQEINYFPNWIEPEYQNQALVKENQAIRENQNQFQIIYAGNIGEAQGFASIVDAIKQTTAIYPDIQWIIAGNGRMLEWVRQQIREEDLEKNVSFLGQLPLKQMPLLFQTADALLVSLKPDPIFNKTIPGKVQSYFAAGKPILAMLDGEGAHLIQEARAGFTCPAGNAEALVENIGLLYSLSLKEREQFGINARQYAKTHFDRESLLTQLENWMQEVIEKNQEAQLK